MDNVEYFNKHRAERLFKQGLSARLIVRRAEGDGMDGVAGAPGNEVILHVGPRMTPPMSLEWDRETFSVDAVFRGQRRAVEVSWANVLDVALLPPPSDGGGRRASA